MNLNLRNPLLVFDLETTGTNVTKDRIIEISMVKADVNGNRTIKTYRVNPECHIPSSSSKIHGIYDEDIKDKPTFKQIAKEIAAFMKGCDIGGYNVLRFDLPVLTEEFLRAGIEFDFSSRKIVDAQKIFFLMEPRTLGAALKFYCGRELEDAHSAEADTIATLDVIDAQVKHYEGVKIKDKNGKEYEPVKNDMNSLHDLTASNLVDFAGRMVLNNEGDPIFNFGKYKGKSVVETLKKDPHYYDWIINNDFALDTKNKLTQLRLKSQFQ